MGNIADDFFFPKRETRRTTPSAAAKTTPRKQIRRLSRRRRREYYFRAVKVLAAEQQPHFSFSPFCYVSSRNEYFSLSFLKLSLFYEMTSSSKHFRESHKANSTSVSHKNKATSSADDGCASIGMEGAFYRVFFSSYNFANVLGARNSVGGD